MSLKKRWEGAGASSQPGKEMVLRNTHSPHKAPAALPPQIHCQQPLHLCKGGGSSRKDRTATPTLLPTARGKGGVGGAPSSQMASALAHAIPHIPCRHAGPRIPRAPAFFSADLGWHRAGGSRPNSSHPEGSCTVGCPSPVGAIARAVGRRGGCSRGRVQMFCFWTAQLNWRCAGSAAKDPSLKTRQRRAGRG